MNPLTAFLVFVAGLGIGFLFYGGLWLTLQRLTRMEGGTLLLAVSFTVRLLVTLALFYLVADGRILRLLLTFAGFFLARLLLIRRLGLKDAAPRNEPS